MLKFLLSRKIRRKKIKFLKENIEPQEVFLDSLAQKQETEPRFWERRFEVSLSEKILKLFFVSIIILILFFWIWSFRIQIIEHKKYSALAQENKFVFRSIQSSRGVIYDSKGKQLVSNKQSFDLVLNKKWLPASLPEKNKLLKKVSKIIGQDVSVLKNKIELEKNQKVLILKNIDHQTLILLETKINNLAGFEIKQNSIRHYNDAKVFSHIIGYMGKISLNALKQNPKFYTPNDYVGKAGLEKSYEKFLRKVPGKIEIEKDARGNLISKRIISLPESGKSLILYIDSDLQKKANEALNKILKKIGAKKGVIIAIDPRNGGVLALLSVPGFDNNLFNRGADQKALRQLLTNFQKTEPLLNRTISGLYPTGSTIKPLIASAALQEKIISPLKKIYAKDKIIIPNKYHPNKPTIERDWAFHGWTDMRKAIAESCNVYFYTIGGGYKDQIGLGPARIKKYLELFGWAKKTNIDLPGESKGSIPSPQWKKKIKGIPWWDGDTYNLAIGQGDILITPIQVAAAFVAIANGGTLYQPEIVKQIINGNASIKNLSSEEKTIGMEIKPKVVRKNFIDPKNLQVVREGMRQAVTGKNSPLASSVLLNSLPVAAAAKTGTAETLRPGYYDNWVTVFAPYEKPQIVLMVMIENVKGIKSATLPVAKEILNWYFRNNAKN